MLYLHKKNHFIVIVISILVSCNAYSFYKETDLFNLSFEQVMSISISSATKRPEEIKNIPASVTIIPRSEIKKYGYTTLAELFRNIPGFYLNNNTEDQRIGIRGTIGGGIQFLVNGVAQHPSIVKGLTMPEISRFNIPIEAIDSIEVVRGPMSVLYGNNAFKGSINIITNDVVNQGSMVAAAYGSQDTGKLFGRFAESLDDGFLALNVGIYQSDGLGGKYRDMMSPAQLATLDPAMHTSLHRDVAHDDLSIDFSSAWQDFSANLHYSNMDYGLYAFTPSFASGNQINLQTFNAMLGYKTQLSNTLTLNSSIIYSHEEYDVPQFDFVFPDAHNSALSQFQEASRTDIELNLVYEPDDDLSVLTGYRYRRIYDVKNEASLVPIGIDLLDVSDNVVQNDVFFQLSYQLFEPLTLVAGNRWTQTKSYVITKHDFIADSTIVRTLHGEEKIFSTPNLAAIYALNDNHIIKLLYGEALQDHRNSNFSEPEEIHTYELNYLATFDQVFLSASVFQNNTDNLLRVVQRFNVTTGQHESHSDNSGELKTLGAELIIKFQPSQNLNLEFSAAWQETDDSKTSIDVGESPQWLAKAKASYQHKNMVYSLFTHYVSRMKSDYISTLKSEQSSLISDDVFVPSATPGQFSRIGEEVDGSISVGANIRYNHPASGFYANLHIENLLDEDIYAPANELVNMQKGLLAQDRQIMLTLGLEF